MNAARSSGELSPGHDQAGHRVRLEWGPTGGAAVAAGADVALVVDVLSFTTTVGIAVERGVRVHPFSWADDRAASYAAAVDATVAVGRLEALTRPGSVSLSPAAMQDVVGIEALVLPSPNGSTISALLAGTGARVVASCLRNRSAVARWLAPLVSAGAVCAVVPAGERWPDGSLRPCAEDLWGAGAVLDALVATGVARVGDLSPEARVAVAAWHAAAPRIGEELASCAGGVELAAKGFAEDVTVAARVDVSDVVPVLDGRAFVSA